jgi:hypothetical protein
MLENGLSADEIRQMVSVQAWAASTHARLLSPADLLAPR